MQSKTLRVNTSKLLAHSQQFGEKKNIVVPRIPEIGQLVTVSIRLNKLTAPNDAFFLGIDNLIKVFISYH